jgi:hypothetical protein
MKRRIRQRSEFRQRAAGSLQGSNDTNPAEYQFLKDFLPFVVAGLFWFKNSLQLRTAQRRNRIVENKTAENGFMKGAPPCSRSEIQDVDEGI